MVVGIAGTSLSCLALYVFPTLEPYFCLSLVTLADAPCLTMLPKHRHVSIAVVLVLHVWHIAVSLKHERG